MPLLATCRPVRLHFLEWRDPCHILFTAAGRCGDNGEGCTLLETTLVNPTSPGSGSSSDISLIPPYVVLATLRALSLPHNFLSTVLRSRLRQASGMYLTSSRFYLHALIACHVGITEGATVRELTVCISIS